LRARSAQREDRATEPEEAVVPKYMFKASFTTKGVRGIAQEGGSARRDAARRAAESVGGTLDAYYFAFGGADAYVIADLPSNEAAAALALTVNASMSLSLETVVLLTPEEMDAAAMRIVEYRPPGGE
jgi:uncharacterized protein with GYD domain